MKDSTVHPANALRVTRIATLSLLTVLVQLPAVFVHASSLSGIFGQTTAGCSSCHGSASSGVAQGSLTFPSSVSSNVLKTGKQYQFTFSNTTNISGKPLAGFNLGTSQSTGTFTNISGQSTTTNTDADEIAHLYPGSNAARTNKSWAFRFRPESTTGGSSFRWCTQPVNRDDSATSADGPFNCGTSTYIVRNNQPPDVTVNSPYIFREDSLASSRTLNITVDDPDQESDEAAPTILWSSAVNLSSQTSSAPLYTGSGSRTYTVTATDSFNGTSGPSTSAAVQVDVDINPQPVASASGSPSTVQEGDLVTLDGASSTDRELSGSPALTSNIASYAWVAPPEAINPSVVGSRLTYTAPPQGPLASSQLQATLTVTDAVGQSDSLDVFVTVNDIAIGEVAPVIQSITPSGNNEGELITLTAVVDKPIADSDANWVQTSGPAVTLGGSGLVRTFSYVEPNAAIAGPTFEFQLIVTDAVELDSDPANVSVTINNGPTAQVVTPLVVDEGSLVQLDGAASQDPEGSLTLSWLQTDGPAILLSDSAVAQPTFTAPDVDREGATATFELTVVDSGGLSSVASTTVQIDNVNQPPVALAGDDQDVGEGAVVTLDGDYTDPDDPGSTISYLWSQVSGPAVSLSSATVPAPEFMAPLISEATVALRFELTVTDEEALSSATDSVTINVGNINQQPTADAGPDQTVAEGATVTLNGTNSDDDADRATLEYWWTQLGGPTVLLSDNAAAMPTFVAPEAGFDTSPVVMYELTVYDSERLFDTDQVMINVTNENIPPVANAGPDQMVEEAASVQLDGTGSSDADLAIDDELSYAWRQLSGAAVALNDATIALPTFTAPPVSATGAALVFDLTVTDRGELVGSDAVIINVSNANEPPVANAGADQSVQPGASVTVSGAASIDPDGGISSYLWSQVSGQPITFDDPSAAETRFTAPAASEDALVLELMVSDAGGLLAQDRVTINLLVDGASAPLAQAGPDATVEEATTVLLDGSASLDADGSIVTYQWTQLGGPAVVVDGANSITATFTAPMVTASGALLVFELRVVDNDGVSASDTVEYTVTQLGDLNPPVSSVLPTGRSVMVGGIASAFATMINTNDAPISGCSIVPLTPFAGSFSYQKTDALTNDATGNLNEAADLDANAAQSFVFALSPAEAVDGAEIALSFDCSNTPQAVVVPGVNTILLSSTSIPTADVVALVSTASNDGVLRIDGAGGAAAVALASVNVGATAIVNASVDVGNLPLTALICSTDPVSAQCLLPPETNININSAAGTTATFSVFVTATGDVAFDPRKSRLRVVFREGGVIRGATGVAVTTE